MDKDKTINNGRISSASLYNERDMLTFTFLIVFKHGICQPYGGYILNNSLCTTILDLFRVLGVDCWDDLDGTNIRVEIGDNGRVYKLGHIIEDRWFWIDDDGHKTSGLDEDDE